MGGPRIHPRLAGPLRWRADPGLGDDGGANRESLSMALGRARHPIREGALVATFHFKCTGPDEHPHTIEWRGLRPDPGPCPSCSSPMLSVLVYDPAKDTNGIVPQGKRSKAGQGRHGSLARYPGDPKANVDGYGHLVRLIDDRKRQAEAKGGFIEETSGGVLREFKPDKDMKPKPGSQGPAKLGGS